MSELDRSNFDAMYWAEKFIEHRDANEWTIEDIDADLMLGWFANYRFAVADPIEAEKDRILAETVGFVFAYACDSLDKGIDPRTVEFPEVLEAAQKAILDEKGK